MVSSIFFKCISLRFRTYFAFGVSESTTKYVDIVRMISSIPSLNSFLVYLVLGRHGEPGCVDGEPMPIEVVSIRSMHGVARSRCVPHVGPHRCLGL
jgi:hypothetical protein